MDAWEPTLENRIRILEAARWFIEHGHTKGALVDENGCCIEGAVVKAAGTYAKITGPQTFRCNDGPDAPVSLLLYDVRNDLFSHLPPDAKNATLAHYNDSHTQEDALYLFDLTIADLRAQLAVTKYQGELNEKARSIG